MKRLKGKQVLAAAFAAVLGASLMGCSLRAGSSSDSNVIESGTTLSTIGAQEITPTPTPDPNEGLLVIGTKASGKHVYKVRFDNETGKTITAFQIRDESEDDFEPDLLQGNEFPSGSKVLCYYDAGDAFKALKASSSADSASESTESAANGQNVVNAAEDIPDFYIQLTFSDGQVAVLHDVPFSEFEEAMICTDAGTYYYLTYETADGTSVTTMKAEKKLKEQADEEAAAAKKKAEEEAAESEAAAKKASEKAAAESEAAAAKKARRRLLRKRRITRRTIRRITHRTTHRIIRRTTRSRTRPTMAVRLELRMEAAALRADRGGAVKKREIVFSWPLLFWITHSDLASPRKSRAGFPKNSMNRSTVS